MDERVKNIINSFDAYSEESAAQTIDTVKQLSNLGLEEKIALTKCLSEIFFHAHHTASSLMLRLALRAGKRIASYGEDIIPTLFDELLKSDSESVAYFGETMAWIGKGSLEYILLKSIDHQEQDHDLINLLQALSYFKIPDTLKSVPFILQNVDHKNHQVSSMALFAAGRIVQRLKSSSFNNELKNEIFNTSFRFLSHAQPLVRKSAVRTLGKMLRKNLLSNEQQSKLRKSFLAISGRDENHNWDRAFIVRRKAEEFLPYFKEKEEPRSIYTQSYKIVSKQLLCANTYHFKIEAPLIARKIEAGQFIIIRPHILSERIPLSICAWNREEGTIEIIVAAVGKTTTQINSMKECECFQDVVGPLGERSFLPRENGTCVVIGGGYGTGAIIPTAKEIKSLGNKVIGIVGARNEETLIMTEELKAACDEVLITTNDGSQGIKGLVTDALKNILDREQVVYILAVGPVPMMKAVSEMTRERNIRTYVSLNAIMVDGTGMCGACRVTVDGETKFACFHGPDFDGHKVDFENLMKRQKMFVKEERMAFSTMNK